VLFCERRFIKVNGGHLENDVRSLVFIVREREKKN